jgi:hypothetical protein
MLKNSNPKMLCAPGVTLPERQERLPFTWQKNKAQTGAGLAIIFAYGMIQIDSEWRINGVYPFDEPALSA